MAQLQLRYPSLSNATSFADIVRISSKYLKSNAIKTAGDHAATFYASHPRMNVNTIRSDTQQALSMNFLDFLTQRSELLRSVTVQRCDELPPESDLAFISMPPRPPSHTLPNFHQLHEGANLIIPPGFVPDGCPMPPPKSPAYALAVEYLHQKDFNAGLSIVLPHATATTLFAAAGLPFNYTPTDIVAATDKPEGRLVVDVTRSRLNHLDKRQQLSDLHGPIIYPRHADWCALFQQVTDAFPGEQLFMFKADFDRWFKRTRINPAQVGLLAMPFHIDGVPYVVIPLVGQFGCMEFNYISSQVSSFIYQKVLARDLRVYGIPVRLCYSDDTAGYLPFRCYAEDDQCFTAIAVEHAGINAAPPTKKSISLTQTTVGALYDLNEETIGLSEATYLKLANVFFNETPQTITPGVTRMPIKWFQRTGSYMCLASSYIPLLRPYTHGVYQDIAGLHSTTRTAPISNRTAIDIAFWRSTLYATVLSTKWLSVPIRIPPLVTRRKDQRKEDFAVYQATNSDIIIGTDACTGAVRSPTWGGGWTANYRSQKTSLWGIYEPQTFDFFLSSIQDPLRSNVDFSKIDHINFYEAIMVVVACHAVLQSLPTDRREHLTLFVWCDNTNAIAWLTHNKTNNPMINFLLQVWARLQALHNVTINCGHIPGIHNIVPDAISRQFLVPDGSAIKANLSHLIPHTNLPSWFNNMLLCSSTPSNTVWHVAHASLTALGNVL